MPRVLCAWIVLQSREVSFSAGESHVCALHLEPGSPGSLAHRRGSWLREPMVECSFAHGDFLDRLEARQRWGFRLCVNPTFREASQVNARGRKKVLAHVTQDQQTQWVLDRSERLGFRVLTSAEYGGDLPVLEDRDGRRVDGANLLINGVERSIAEFKRQGARVTLLSRLSRECSR